MSFDKGRRERLLVRAHGKQKLDFQFEHTLMFIQPFFVWHRQTTIYQVMLKAHLEPN
jgi:hypothetical protein